MTPGKKAEYRKLAEEVMEPVLTVAARRLGQAVEEIHTSQIKPLRDEIERLREANKQLRLKVSSLKGMIEEEEERDQGR